MAAFKPAYLVRGDDHGRIAERRASLRAVAERESGAAGVELFEGDASTPEAVAAALGAMTFAMGRRFVVADGAERYKEADVERQLAPVLAQLDLDTTVAFFAREEGRAKAPAKLAKAVEAAGGVVVVEDKLKPKELPRWIAKEASRLGIELAPDAARALVAQVGDRQQRLLREVEKLALERGPGAQIGPEDVDEAAAHSSGLQVWSLVDALVARDEPGALRAFLELRAQGESMPRLVPLMARRVRDVQLIAQRLEAGEAPQQIKASVRMSPWQADKRIAEARRSDAAALGRALEALADLELGTRGDSELADDTSAVRTIAAITA